MEKRKTRRALTTVRGSARIGGHDVHFRTHNISVGGSLVQLENGNGLYVGANIHVWLTDLGFGAYATVCWISPQGGNEWLAGLRFDEMEYSPGFGNAHGNPAGG